MNKNTIKHDVDGRDYEIRSMQTDQGWEVAAFRDGKRVSPLYSVSFEVGEDFQNYHGQRAVEALLEIARSDLDAGIVK